MTDELVENVRQAIWDALRNAHGFDASPVPKERTDITALATAALAVLRQHLVPRATGDDGELVERLTKKSWRFVSRKGQHGQEQYLINPDGPEAADRITALSAEVKRLEAALRAIRYEADRENGNWRHMKRCIAVQAKAALGA